jgi:hypothetical protein
MWRRWSCVLGVASLVGCIAMPELHVRPDGTAGTEPVNVDEDEDAGATRSGVDHASTSFAEQDAGPEEAGAGADASRASAPDAPAPVGDDEDGDEDKDKDGQDDEAPCGGGTGATCCGSVSCVGCPTPQSRDCRKCEEACARHQICCKERGTVTCKALTEGC